MAYIVHVCPSQFFGIQSFRASRYLRPLMPVVSGSEDSNPWNGFGETFGALAGDLYPGAVLELQVRTEFR